MSNCTVDRLHLMTIKCSNLCGVYKLILLLHGFISVRDMYTTAIRKKLNFMISLKQESLGTLFACVLFAYIR